MWRGEKRENYSGRREEIKNVERREEEAMWGGEQRRNWGGE